MLPYRHQIGLILLFYLYMFLLLLLLLRILLGSLPDFKSGL